MEGRGEEGEIDKDLQGTRREGILNVKWFVGSGAMQSGVKSISVIKTGLHPIQWLTNLNVDSDLKDVFFFYEPAKQRNCSIPSCQDGATNEIIVYNLKFPRSWFGFPIPEKNNFPKSFETD